MAKRNTPPPEAAPEAAPETPNRSAHDLPDLDQIKLADILFDDNHRVILDPVAERRAIEELAASMQTSGQQTPIRVRRLRGGSTHPSAKRFILIAGGRRCAAAELSAWPTIRAEVYAEADAHTIETERALENLQREGLTILDEAEIVARQRALLADADDEATDANMFQVVAAALGKDPRWVRERWFMMRVCPQVKRLAGAGILLAGHLIELAKVGDPNEQMSIALWSLRVGYHDRIRNEKGREKAAKRILDGLVDGQRPATPTVDAIRQAVVKSQRSLRLVPWLLDQPVAKRRPCDGCPYNNRTVETLYGPAAEDDRGQCLDGQCFELKTRAAEKAKKAAVKKLVRKGDAGVAAVTAVTPDWLKTTTVQRAAQKELAAADGGSGGKSKGSPKVDRYADVRKALVAFDKALSAWMEAAWQAIAMPGSDPKIVACLLLLQHCEAFDVEFYSIETNWWPETAKPKTPGRMPRLSSEAAMLLELACNGDFDELTAHVSLNRRHRMQMRHLQRPSVLLHMADKLGVSIDVFPEWPEFDPANAAEPSPAAGKPKRKKKAARRVRKRGSGTDMAAAPTDEA